MNFTAIGARCPIKLDLDSIFHSRYTAYENYLYNTKPLNYFICPIQNLISANNILLDGGSEIRNVTEKELLNLVRSNEWLRDRVYFYPGLVLCVPDCENSKDFIYNIVTALRLLKKERVGVSRLNYVYALPTRPWKIIELSGELAFKDTPPFGTYNLTEEEVEEFKSLVLHFK